MVSVNIIREIILENRDEVMRHVVVPRKVSIDGFDRQVIVGVRRAGKSYLLYDKMQRLIRDEGKTWDDMLYLNFEDERLAGMEAHDLNNILEAFGSISARRPILFLDEIQNVEGWSKFARRQADNKYQIYITGSNAKMLSREIESELGGRFISREVFPYDYEEFLRANEIDTQSIEFLSTTSSRGQEKAMLRQYYDFGGFPEVATQAVKRDYLMSLYQKIFLGDIAARHKIENMMALRMLYRKLSESVGQPLSFTRIANIIRSTGTKISTDTVIKYIEYAREAYLVYGVPNYAAAIAEKESNLKYYIIDNGILSILGLNANLSLFENIVGMSLIRQYGRNQQLFYYKNGIDVDFYIPDEETAIQACYDFADSPNTRAREIGALVKLNQRFPCRRNIIVSYALDQVIIEKGIRIEVISLSNFLLLLATNY